MLRILRCLLAPLLLGLLVAGLGRAEEEKPGEQPGEQPGEEPDEPVGQGPDLGDQNVPFAEQVNQAIDRGVVWLRARGTLFDIPGTEGLQGAHWGLVKGERIYGGGDGPQYRHPAGPTALALYTLLKCDVSPRDPMIERGFAWLRTVHQITEEWDGQDASGKTRHWNHTIAGSSYELSVMILALTAKYDPYKKTSQTEVVRRRGKLKIKDRDDRVWLQQLVTALLERRGQPTSEPTELDLSTIQRIANPEKEEPPPAPAGELRPPAERRGWRYNLPHLNLVEVRKSGRSSSRDGWTRGGSLPPNANQDLSSTQLAALALFAAHQFGVEVPVEAWFDIVDFTLDHQEAEGPEHARHDPVMTGGGYAAPKDHARGFAYIKGSPDGTEGIATGSMTACGITNLLLAKQIIEESPKGKKEWGERALDRKVDTAIWDGLAWLDRNWSAFLNPKSSYGYHTYYLYAIERAQDLRRKELVGKHVWYVEGATELLKIQQAAKVKDPLDARAPEADGVFWNTKATHDPKDVLDTCFTLLFLKRATRNLAPGAVTPADAGMPVDNR